MIKDCVKQGEKKIPHIFFYDIYISNETFFNCFYKIYLTRTVTPIMAIKEFYQYIIVNFDLSGIKEWKHDDIQKIAVIIFNSIGRLNDYQNEIKPKNGMKLVVKKVSSWKVDHMLYQIQKQ